MLFSTEALELPKGCELIYLMKQTTVVEAYILKHTMVLKHIQSMTVSNLWCGRKCVNLFN